MHASGVVEDPTQVIAVVGSTPATMKTSKAKKEIGITSAKQQTQ